MHEFNRIYAQLTQKNLDSHASTYSTTPARRKAPGMPGASNTLAEDPEERLKAALTDLRCLMICISLLERVNSVRLGRTTYSSCKDS